jgi:delta 1-pyrroline-5-carboxylate dehydrogenase
MSLADIQAAAGLKTPIRHQLFIDGKFVDAASGMTAPTLNPHNNTTIADVAMAGKEDVDRAVAAAQKAFPKWSRMAAADRGRILLRWTCPARQPPTATSAAWPTSSRATWCRWSRAS